MKKDHYSGNYRLFTFWTDAHIFQKGQFCHANAMFDSEFCRRKIIKNLRSFFFLKVSWDKVGFEAKIIFLTKVHRHKSALRKGERFGHFSQVTWCPQSLGRLFVLFPILCFLSNCRVFSRLLKYMRELYSRISCVVQDNWMLLLTYCENAWSYRVLN